MGMIDPNKMSFSDKQDILDAIGTDPEEEALQSKLAQLKALRGGGHTTGIGGALGAAANVLNTVNEKGVQDDLKNQVYDVRAKGQRAYGRGLFGFGGDEGLTDEDMQTMYSRMGE